MTNIFISDAWAQAGETGSSMFSLLPLVLIFVLFYFLLIRPQQKKKKQHKSMIAAISVGDEVVTNGGLLGKVTDLDDNFVRLDIAQGKDAKSVEVQVQRHAIAQMIPSGTFKESGDKRKRKKAKDNEKEPQSSDGDRSESSADSTSVIESKDAEFEEQKDDLKKSE